MVVTPEGSIYFYGDYLSSSITIGSTTITGAIIPPGATWDSIFYNAFLAKFDRARNNEWAQNLGDHMLIQGMAADTFENLYVTGTMTRR